MSWRCAGDRGRLGQWLADNGRREERENEGEKESVRTRGRKKKRKRKGWSDSITPIRSGSIQPVRFKIPEIEFLLCPGTKNEA